MLKPKNITDGPEYDKAAAAFSMSTIAYFLATFVYLVMFSGSKPSFLYGAGFVLAGMFISSIMIAFPLFFIKYQIPKLAPIIVIANILLTIFVTRAAYLWLFEKQTLTSGPFVVVCDEPIPEFTLGNNSNPSETQVKSLCDCIWKNLDGADKELFLSIEEGKANSISAVDQQRLTSSLGSSIRACGGMGL